VLGLEQLAIARDGVEHRTIVRCEADRAAGVSTAWNKHKKHKTETEGKKIIQSRPLVWLCKKIKCRDMHEGLYLVWLRNVPSIANVGTSRVVVLRNTILKSVGHHNGVIVDSGR